MITATATVTLGVHDVAVDLGGRRIVDGVDLTVERGDVFGYLGPNGAGKTTSLRMLLGLIRPSEGRAELFGRDPLEVGARALDGVAGFVDIAGGFGGLVGEWLGRRRRLDHDRVRTRLAHVMCSAGSRTARWAR